MACSGCESATVRTRANLTWAIPVDIEVLGPHLEAYIKIKPVLHQLRLCHRFGRGAEAHLDKLPQELLEMVIDNVLQSNRARFAPYSKWSKPFRCYQRLCEGIDHYHEDEVQELSDQALENLLDDGIIDYEDPDMEEAIEQEVREMCAERDYYETCYNRRVEWKLMVEQKPSGHLCTKHANIKCDFDKLADILTTDFGLGAFMSHQVIKESMKPFATYSDWCDEPVFTTLSYLTLPTTTCYDGLSDGDGAEEPYEYTGFHAESTLFSIIDPSSLQITAEQKKRFYTAMKTLDLKPFLRECQLPSVERGLPNPLQAPQKTLGAPSQEYLATVATRREATKRVKEFETSKWPKLLNLVATEVNMYVSV